MAEIDEPARFRFGFHDTHDREARTPRPTENTHLPPEYKARLLAWAMGAWDRLSPEEQAAYWLRLIGPLPEPPGSPDPGRGPPHG